jgi:hypothetical protein
MSQAKQPIASDVIPPAPKVNSLQALTRLRTKGKCDWCVFAFSLNRDMIKPDGTLDELHAMVFPLGAFHEQNEAEDHATNVIAITGHPGVIAARYATPVPLTTKFDPKTVTEVAVDTKGRLIEMESAQYKREREEYERRMKQEREVAKEAEEETDPNSIEHFKRQCYLAIKNRASYETHRREADAAWENYKKREMAVRDHYARHPEHEAGWLPYLKEKLTERGEMPLYLGLEAAYKEIRDEILGLEEECEGGVCPVQPSTESPKEIVEVPKPEPLKEVVEVPKPEPPKEVVEVPKPEPPKEVVEVSKPEPPKETVQTPTPPKEAPKVIPLMEVKKVEIPRPISRQKESARAAVPKVSAPPVPAPPKIPAPPGKSAVPMAKIAVPKPPESEVRVTKPTDGPDDDEIISAEEAIEHVKETTINPDPGFVEELDDEAEGTK